MGRLLRTEHSACPMRQLLVLIPAPEGRAPKPVLLCVDSGTSTVAFAPTWPPQHGQQQQQQQRQQQQRHNRRGNNKNRSSNSRPLGHETKKVYWHYALLVLLFATIF